MPVIPDPSSGTPGYRLTADVGQLSAAAERLAGAARAVRALHDHPGVLRGRAAECGDDELAAALTGFARAWQHGLDAVGHEALRWSMLLRAAADAYAQAERDATGAAAGLSR